jgi:hypothetical protein
MAEEKQEAGEGPHQNEAQENVKEELPIGPARIPARRGPCFPGDHGDHLEEFLSSGLQVVA